MSVSVAITGQVYLCIANCFECCVMFFSSRHVVIDLAWCQHICWLLFECSVSQVSSPQYLISFICLIFMFFFFFKKKKETCGNVLKNPHS